MDAEETVLAGGNVNDVVRAGDTVRRSAGPWTPTVHALLAWVRAQGVTQVPAPLGTDEQGREVLTYVEGEVPQYPMPAWVWSPDVLAATGRLLRRWHDATTGFDLRGATWRSPVREPAEVVCLGDVAPYNMVFRDRELVSLIDVDMASPGPRLWDLAYLAYRICPLGEDAPSPGDTALDGQDPLERLEALAAWTDEHARNTGRPELHEHAAMYRRDAARADALGRTRLA